MKEHKKGFSYYGRKGNLLVEKIEGSYLDPRVGEEIADWTGGAPPDKLMTC
jgi:hypothetical protein